MSRLRNGLTGQASVVGITLGEGARSDRRETEPPPREINKWLCASVVDDAADVIASVFNEADRRDGEHQRAWVALVDGNNHQIDRITYPRDHIHPDPSRDRCPEQPEPGRPRLIARMHRPGQPRQPKHRDMV